MTGREKVMKGLQCLSSPYAQDMNGRDCENCQYDNASCFLDITADALALLKEQEAIKPYRHYARCGTNHNGMDFWYNCGSCKTEILENDKYCHECGQAVKWDD